MAELTYVMLKPRKVGAGIRHVGELVPEAEEWRNRNSYISRGVISAVPVDGLDEHSKKILEDWRNAQKQREQERQQQEAPEEDSSPAVAAVSSGVDLSDKTTGDVKELVTTGKLDPVEAWEAESEGKARSTLLSWLEEQVPDDEG